MKRFLVLVGIGLFLAVTTTVAHPNTKFVAPSGGDDTAAIQAALNWCAAAGPKCTVQLSAGRFHVGLIAVNNFRGTLKGAGMGNTVIYSNSNLALDDPDNWLLYPPGPTNHWPYLFTFVDGDITVSDLSIKIADPTPFATPIYDWFNYGKCLMGAITITGTGTAPTNSLMNHVSVEGLYKPGTSEPDSTPILPYNLFAAFSVQGALYTPAWDLIYLGGQHRVLNSMGKGALVGFAAWDMQNAKVVVGGSSDTGNRFEDTGYSIEGEELIDSSQEISFNSVKRATGFAVNILQDAGWSSTSQFSIHDNKISTVWVLPESPDYADAWIHRAISVWTDAAVDGISSADVSRNELQISYQQPPDEQYVNAISVFGADIARVKRNEIQGTGQRGIDVSRTSDCNLIWNDVSDYSASIAAIELRPTTSGCLVVGKNLAATVLDLGTGNSLIDMGTGGGNAASVVMTPAMTAAPIAATSAPAAAEPKPQRLHPRPH
jgi:hypothetical protein